MLEPDTPSTGRVVSTERPAATVVKLVVNGAARWVPSVSVAAVETVTP